MRGIVSLRNLGLWLRKSVPLFKEERFLGRILIRLRALGQIPWLLLREPTGRSLRKARLCLRVSSRHTMISPSLLFAMYDVAEAAIREGAKGDIVECGVWNGGSAALLAEAAGIRDGGRACWLFDSFQGLPEPTERDPEEIRRYWFRGWNTGDPERVAGIWKRLGLPGEALRIREGWFHESFDRAPIESIAILHIDADWYEPVRLCLETWYGKVGPGGAVILNDYGLWDGATRAVDDFLRERELQVEILPLGRVGAWFRKPA